MKPIDQTAPIDELRNRAFKLAYLILNDRAAAIRVAMAAMERLRVTSTAQDKRLYYTPTGRSIGRAARNKVFLSEIHLLQRLVYIESEPFERWQEQGGKALAQEDMIIRFVKHLVRITLRRNSFYVMLGLCRVLNDYTTVQAKEIYSFIVQDPDRAKEGYYYRSRKRQLIYELKERFGTMLKTLRGHQGEERFQAQENSLAFSDLIRECLIHFTPWYSPCVLPVNFDPDKSLVNSLSFSAGDPDEEHTIELNRIHTLLHPVCFRKVVVTLGFDPPEQRLTVPYFFFSDQDGGITGDRFNPPDLDEKELNSFKQEADNNASRRRRASGGLLAVLVDGVERARFEVNQTASLQLEVEESELLEVRAMETDGEILLATHLLAHNESGVVPSKSFIVLEGGQQLSFDVQALSDEQNSETRALIKIAYRETSLLKSMPRRLRRFGLPVRSRIAPLVWGGLRAFKLPLGIALLILCLAGLFLYWRSRSHAPTPPVAEQTNGNRESEAPPIARVQKPPEGPVTGPGSANVSKPGAGAGRVRPSGKSEDDEATRVLRPGTAPATLVAVKQVYVDPLGDDPLSQQTRAALTNSLQSSSYFVVVQNRDAADAVFEGYARSVKGGGHVVLALQLVAADGAVIWPLAPKNSTKQYAGDPATVTAKAVRELLDIIRRLQHKH